MKAFKLMAGALAGATLAACTLGPDFSRPEAPASERKQGVRAVSRSGSSASSVIASRTRLVKETSAVGMRYFGSSPTVLNKSSSNFGSWPVPNMASSFTSKGGLTST